jgi:prepilin-type N-terminal cleavage/methylation domain-containing protein/prepilin-type processing-associated H-X9-DG protein
MKRRYKKSGFTLVELLVVIAIIALLLAVLIPALEKAKKQAKTIVCGTRQKQVGLGLVAYTNDYDGFIMPAALMTDKWGVTYNGQDGWWYHNADPRKWNAVMEFWYVNLWVHKYVADADAFFCPDFFPFDYKGHEAFAKLAEDNGNTPHVHFNKTSGEAFILGMRDWSYADSTVFRGAKRVSKILQPAKFFMVADSVNLNYKNMALGYPKPTQDYRIMILERASSLGHFSGVHLRHGNKASTIFADGHVGREDERYFLDIHDDNNWQHPYSKPGPNITEALTGYRVYAKNNKEWQWLSPGVYRLLP